MSAPTSRAAVADLVSGLIQAAIPDAQIFRARDWPLQVRETKAEAPAILVYAWDETKTRSSEHTFETTYAVSCTLTVDLKVTDRARDATEVEIALENTAGAVCDAVLRSPDMIGPSGKIERIQAVRTTLGVSLQGTERSIGEGRIAFDLQWSEPYELLPPAVICDDASVAFHLIPPLPAS
jgi:hypothetical protein